MLRLVGSHPNIVEMKNLEEDPKNYYLVLELCTGGVLPLLWPLNPLTR